MNSNVERASKSLWLIGGAALLAGLVCFVILRQPKPAPLPVVAHHDLVQRDSKWYSGTNPFTGIMLDVYPAGATMSRSTISNGLANGLSELWYTNGQIQMRENFVNGVSDGLRQKFYDSGAKMSEAVIVKGEVTGIFKSWFPNGQLKEQIEMKEGKPDGVGWAFYPSGYASAETSVRAGKVLNRRTWKDGEYKTNL